MTRTIATLTLLSTVSATSLFAQQDKPANPRFQAVGKRVMAAINADDRNSLHALCNPTMKALLTPAVLDSVFIPLRAGTGKLLAVQPPTVFQAGAIMRVRGENADCQFRIELDAGGKISGLWVTTLPDRLPVDEMTKPAEESKRKTGATKKPVADRDSQKSAGKAAGPGARSALLPATRE